MMETRTYSLQLDEAHKNHSDIQAASVILRQGGLVAFPTETVYGLGADATQSAAVERIFQVKGRPADNPLIVHASSIDQVLELVDEAELNSLARSLMEHFWPGPLTLVLPSKKGVVAPQVTAGLDTIAVRIPDHPVALALIEASGRPIAAPSANRSGRPSPTLASHVLEDLSGRIEAVVDGGATGVGLESTVAAVHGERIDILRPGGVTAPMLREFGAVVTYETEEAEDLAAPRSPGVKYTHYAPRGSMTLVKSHDAGAAHKFIQGEINKASSLGERTGILTYKEHASDYQADVVLSCGQRNCPEETAHTLYAALREMDHHGVTYILSDLNFFISIGENLNDSLLAAIENRLLKAAGHRVIVL